MTPSVADLVERNFTRHVRDQLWVTDITEHPTLEGKVYCAVVLDTFSRRVVGWSIDASPTAALTTDALAMAIGNRSPRPGGTIIHSDHGVQGGFNRSWAFTQRALASGLLPSMGSIGDCVDKRLSSHCTSSPIAFTLRLLTLVGGGRGVRLAGHGAGWVPGWG
ncbi:DDE-type integrase/transposase/recombinase [Streptomyces sp. GTA36]